MKKLLYSLRKDLDYYMGCFADQWGVFDFNLDNVNYPGMTVEYCIGYCTKRGYSVAGVQTR